MHPRAPAVAPWLWRAEGDGCERSGAVSRSLLLRPSGSPDVEHTCTVAVFSTIRAADGSWWLEYVERMSEGFMICPGSEANGGRLSPPRAAAADMSLRAFELIGDEVNL